MSIESHGHEHELEPQYGLPERLPTGESILWQGAPDFRALALQVFHVRKVAIYFAVLMALRVSTQYASGMALDAALMTLMLPMALALSALAALTALAWLTAKTTVYTLTDKRVVLRIGIVLTLALNVPLRQLVSAGLRRQGNGAGDIVMQIGGDDHMAWLHLWPHVRPWRIARPEPMLRAIADAPRIAQLLAQAWSAQTGITTSAPDAQQPADVASAGSMRPHLQPSLT